MTVAIAADFIRLLGGRHAFRRHARERSYDWLDHWLRPDTWPPPMA